MHQDVCFFHLYDDNKKDGPRNDWVSLPNGRVLKQLGTINTNIMMTRYKGNAMPYYIIVDAQGNEIIPPRGYNLDIEAFIKFLQNGIAAYNK